MTKIPYLGKGKATTSGYVEHMVVMETTKLSNRPHGHIVVLGSVTPEFAVALNGQIHERLYKYYKRFKSPEDLFEKVLSGLKLPRTHELVRLGSEKGHYSELRVKSLPRPQAPEAIRTEVKKAFDEGYPLEFIYKDRPNDLESEYGWRSPSRQVEVTAVDEEGFRASHGRGLRRYRWEKVERAVALAVNGWTLLPELCIEMAIPYETSNPEQRVGFIVTRIHRWESNYELGSVKGLIYRPSMAQGLRNAWG